jgi:two-component system, cell cycle sensor histidine kinase and response regulator CckA
MAAGVAHNFNNTLYVAIGNLEMAREDLPPGSDALGNIVEAEKATRRAADMSRLMLTYLGHQQIQTRTMDLSETVENLLKILRNDLPTGTAVEEDLPSPGPVVSADENGMEQILKALILNAVEAMENGPSGGVRVSIETAASASIPEKNRFPVDWVSGARAYASLTVADTGKGMDGAAIDAVFDPFYTDKFTGRGLGLPVVLGIVKAHGGCITVDSAPGRGSVFRVFLPLSSEPVPPASHGTERASAPGSEDGAVLLVDDQEPVRDMAQTMLQRLGFPVIPASSGEEAAAIVRDKPDRIRLVISDLTMPGMDGWKTLAEIRKIHPDIPAILMSGYDKSQVMTGDHTEHPQGFLQKPFDMKQLEKTLGRALGQSQ